jgi:hypothetical protein
MVWVRKGTIPTERLPLVGEVIATQFCYTAKYMKLEYLPHCPDTYFLQL